MSLNGESAFGANGRPQRIPVLGGAGPPPVGPDSSGLAPCLAGGHPWLRPIRNAEELQRVAEALTADGDGVVSPTHVVEIDGEIVGAVALGSVVLVDVWASRTKIKARNSLLLLNLIENLAAARGAKVLCLPCTVRSPYRPFMTKFGFRYAGETGMFYKQIG